LIDADLVRSARTRGVVDVDLSEIEPNVSNHWIGIVGLQNANKLDESFVLSGFDFIQVVIKGRQTWRIEGPGYVVQ